MHGCTRIENPIRTCVVEDKIVHGIDDGGLVPSRLLGRSRGARSLHVDVGDSGWVVCDWGLHVAVEGRDGVVGRRRSWRAGRRSRSGGVDVRRRPGSKESRRAGGWTKTGAPRACVRRRGTIRRRGGPRHRPSLYEASPRIIMKRPWRRSWWRSSGR